MSSPEQEISPSAWNKRFVRAKQKTFKRVNYKTDIDSDAPKTVDIPAGAIGYCYAEYGVWNWVGFTQDFKQKELSPEKYPFVLKLGSYDRGKLFELL